MHGKHILITGATGGIGGALARVLAKQGAKLSLTGRNTVKLEQLADSLPGEHHTTIQADLSHADGRCRILSQIQNQSRPLDVLVNAAGVNDFDLLENTDDAKIAELLTSNLLAPMQLTRLLLKQLNQEQAQIVNIGSTLGSIGHPGYSVYCASKFGLRGFSQALARELSDTATTVQYIAPRTTNTAMNQDHAAQMNASLGNATDDPLQVAEQIAKAIKSKSNNVYLGWPERLFVTINNIASPLVDIAIRQKLTTIKKFAQGVS